MDRDYLKVHNDRKSGSEAQMVRYPALIPVAVTVLAALCACSTPQTSAQEPQQSSATSGSDVPSGLGPTVTTTPMQEGQGPGSTLRPEGTPRPDACAIAAVLVSRLPGSPPSSTSLDQDGSLLCTYVGPKGGPEVGVIGKYQTAETAPTVDPLCSAAAQYSGRLSVPWVDSRGWVAFSSPPTAASSLSVALCVPRRGFYTVNFEGFDGSVDDALGLLKAILV